MHLLFIRIVPREILKYVGVFNMQGTGINVPPGPVKVSALMAWSLLLSTVDPQKVSSHHLPS